MSPWTPEQIRTWFDSHIDILTGQGMSDYLGFLDTVKKHMPATAKELDVRMEQSFKAKSDIKKNKINQGEFENIVQTWVGRSLEVRKMMEERGLV